MPPVVAPWVQDHAGETLWIYNCFAGLALLVGVAMLLWQLRLARIPLWHALVLPVVAFLVGRVGAGIFFSLETGFWETDWTRYLSPERSGLSFYGGFFAAALLVAAYGAASGIGAARLADAFSAPTAFGYAVGRLGCLFSGCCASHLILPAGWSMPAVVPNPTALPVQGLDSLLMLGAGLLLLRIPISNRAIRFAWFLVLMGCSRMAVDTLRDTRAIVAGLSMVDMLSVPLVALGSLMILLDLRRRSRFRLCRVMSVPAESDSGTRGHDVLEAFRDDGARLVAGSDGGRVRRFRFLA